MNQFTSILKSTGIAIIILALLPVTGMSNATLAQEESEYYSDALVFFNESCSGCSDYLFEDMRQIFADYGIDDPDLRDYINFPSERPVLRKIVEDLQIPFDLESHIMIFLGDDIVSGEEVKVENIRVVLAGHIPLDMTRYLIQRDNLSTDEKVIVYQDKMPNMEEVMYYKVWDFSSAIKQYDINEPITTYLAWMRSNAPTPDNDSVDHRQQALLPTVLVTGFLDGLNPCAFAVLLLFISYLFTIKRTRAGILKMGIIYIIAIYLAYLLIGIGLLKAVLITGIPHFMAWVGAAAVIFLGLLNVINHFLPKFPIRLSIPDFSKGVIAEYMYRATVPAAFILGFVVGLCTFPCSGGPYVAVILMLSSQTEWMTGMSYLLLYNLMFVLPLIIILALAGNRYTTKQLESWKSKEAGNMHLLGGLLMIALGLIIILYLV